MGVSKKTVAGGKAVLMGVRHAMVLGRRPKSQDGLERGDVLVSL